MHKYFANILLLILSFALIGYIIRTIYVAFIKKKDERSKWIVTKSMAESFIVITIMHAVLLVVKFANYSFYQQWWPKFKEAIYIDPVLINVIILGIILIVNSKKHGGSL